jgi:hypothetical protein
VAGGDWEAPLLYVLYWDGRELRGYVPTKGNPFNTDTKTAYGSEHEVMDDDEAEKAMVKNLKARFGVEDKHDAEPDAKAIEADIDANVRYAPGISVPFKGLADVDWAAIEKAVAEREAEEKEYESRRKSGGGSGWTPPAGVYVEDDKEAKRAAQVAAEDEADEEDWAAMAKEHLARQAQSPKQPCACGHKHVAMTQEQVQAALVAVQEDCREFEAGLNVLAGTRLQPGAGQTAAVLRDVVLRRLVGRFVQVLLEIEGK